VTSTVAFGSGRRAAVVRAGADTEPADLLTQLELKPGQPVVVVAGGAKTLTGDALELVAGVVGPGIAQATAVAGAAVVDGGTAAGVMEIVGEAMGQRRDEDIVLLGVAPGGCVSFPGSPADVGDDGAALEPNHSHFVLADTDQWGGETALLVDLSEALAQGSPIAMVVAGGGEVTRKEILEAVRRRWPVFVVAGSGGTADALARAWRTAHERRPARPAADGGAVDRVLQEIVRDGDLRLYQRPDPDELARRLAWELQDEEVLKLAWRSFATYDELAGKARMSFERIQTSILIVGIVATFLALLKGALDIRPGSSLSWIDDALHWTVVALPILVAVLVGWAYRMGAGKRWVLLRGAAETVKREIYRYRTATGAYGTASEPEAPLSAQEILSAQLDAIESKLLQTEASGAELTPYSGPLPPKMYGASRNDDGLSRLDPERYLAFRVGDQLSYFHPKVKALARTRRRLQFAALVAGGLGAVLAAAGFEVWIGLTTAIATAALAYLGYLQVESTLVAYNQSAGKLEALRRGWEARPLAQRDRKAFDDLVAGAEAVLATEVGGWVQQMNQALEEMQAKQMETERQAEARRPTSAPRDPSED
jgi:hypothetical protein